MEKLVFLHFPALCPSLASHSPIHPSILQLLAPYTGLASLVTRIVTLPNIANWLAARPNTVM